jgi:hypothetical protein
MTSSDEEDGELVFCLGLLFNFVRERNSWRTQEHSQEWLCYGWD